MARALILEQSTSDTYKVEDFGAFINEVLKGNVLLVIGKAFEVNNEEYEGCYYRNDTNTSIYGWLLKALNETYLTDAVSFSDLSKDKSFVRKDDKEPCEIHCELVKAIKKAQLSIDDVSPQLIKLLRTGYFKFVFTTSFDPLVEIAMKEQWGDIRIKNIYDEDTENHDIDNASDLQIPTLYYLFGKADKNTFVATDIDALDAVRRWLQRSSSSKLLKETSRKYILTLGCDYDDWLFRIIWFILKGESNNLKDGYVAQYSNNKELERFLIRNKILIDNDSSKVVDTLVEELEKREDINRWKNPNHCDVFISYSRKDGQIVEELYDSLEKKGLDVWYDRINLAGRGDKYMAKILNAIQNCKIFIPVLTSTITEQKGTEHPYREEWDYAIKRYKNLGRHNFCIPLVEDKYDIKKVWYDDFLPKEFPDMDCSFFDREELDFEEFSKMTQNILLNL
ncbi:MAG: toll/interleukin-1 receptor domain-containing protein [Bacteroidales bacterium]|nr:toll/interleukin-1 receptor domain-containing protein [Bacteroidales bacterium]